MDPLLCPFLASAAEGLAQLTSNEYLVMAGTLHGVHAITSKISPVSGSSGVQSIEAETFKMNVLLTLTGELETNAADAIKGALES